MRRFIAIVLVSLFVFSSGMSIPVNAAPDLALLDGGNQPIIQVQDIYFECAEDNGFGETNCPAFSDGRPIVYTVRQNESVFVWHKSGGCSRFRVRNNGSGAELGWTDTCPSSREDYRFIWQNTTTGPVSVYFTTDGKDWDPVLNTGWYKIQ